MPSPSPDFIPLDTEDVLSTGEKIEAAERQKAQIEREIRSLRLRYEEEQEIKKLTLELERKQSRLGRPCGDIPCGWRISRRHSPEQGVRERSPVRERVIVRERSPRIEERLSVSYYSIKDIIKILWARFDVPGVNRKNACISVPILGKVKMTREGIFVAVNDQGEVIGIAYNPEGAPAKTTRFWGKIISFDRELYFCQIDHTIPFKGKFYNRAMIFSEVNDEQIQRLIWGHVVHKNWSHDINEAPFRVYNPTK